MYSNRQSEASAFPHPGCFEALLRYGRSGDVGNRVIGQWQVGVPGPTRGTERRTSLGGQRRPQSEVLEDNLTVKVGGLGMLYCGWDFHLRDVPPSSQELAAAWRPYVEACIEAFGPNRCMMESNFPVDKQSCGYGVLWNALKRITHGCSATEKAALYRDTAARVYRLAV